MISGMRAGRAVEQTPAGSLAGGRFVDFLRVGRAAIDPFLVVIANSKYQVLPRYRKRICWEHGRPRPHCTINKVSDFRASRSMRARAPALPAKGRTLSRCVCTHNPFSL